MDSAFATMTENGARHPGGGAAGATLERVMTLPLLAREKKEVILGANPARLLGLGTLPAPGATR